MSRRQVYESLLMDCPLIQSPSHSPFPTMYFGSFQVQGNFEANGSTADTVTTQTLTIDDLSATYTPEQSLAVINQRDVTGRRCHKTLKGGGEAVWPPSLEAALIAGLRVYSDRHRIHMRHRGRFIGRNHFLSAYVMSVTGRRRTAKQVGSRLQQLKDTCREPGILYLITGSRSLSPRRDYRRGRKSSWSRSSPPRPMSISPELPDEVIEEILYPGQSSSLQQLPCTRIPQPMAYFAASLSPVSSIYQPQSQFSYSNDQYFMDQNYTSSQCYNYSCEWSDAVQPPSIYLNPQQQWESYYPSDGYQQHYAYYNSQY